LEAEATLEEADARLAECVTVHDVAVRMWQTLEAAALRDRQCTRFAQANALAREGQALLDEDRMDRDATSQRCGLQPGGEHPAPVAAQLVAVLGYFRRQLDPPPPPPRPGCIRLRCTARVYDGQAGMGILRRVDDIFDVATEPAEYLREILAQKLAEPIEA
jgi:hypothetical protein